MNKLTFILHGKNLGNKKLVAGIHKVFGTLYETEFLFTEYAGHAIELSKTAASGNSDYVIATGGDGTMNEVANGVMHSGNKKVKVGLLPHGTGNDFAKTMKVNSDPAGLKLLIETNSTKAIDLGLMQFTNTGGQEEHRYFINIADVGLGGCIAQKLAHSSKWMGAFLTFQKAILSTFLTYRHQWLQVRADDFVYEGKILSYIIANGKFFGAGLGIAPDAEPDDGLFEIVLGAEISLWDYLKNLGKVRRCEKIVHPEMSYHKAKDISIKHMTLPVDMDGEFIGYTPMRITIVPGAINFLCGK